MKMLVQQIIVPVGSSIGYVIGHPDGDPTKVAVAATDWRSARALAEVLTDSDDERPLVDMPDWMVVDFLELP